VFTVLPQTANTGPEALVAAESTTPNRALDARLDPHLLLPPFTYLAVEG
jgi:hypothetical protein